MRAKSFTLPPNFLQTSIIVFLLLLLALCGILMQLSAGNGNFFVYAFSQTSKVIISFIVMFIVYLLPLNLIMMSIDVVYAICLILVILVNFLGAIHLGAQRWLHFGPLIIQPSELMKIALVLILAKFLHNTPKQQQGKLTNYIIPCLLSVVPFLLIVVQPDLGTALIIMLITLILFFVSGLKLRYFGLLGLFVIIATPILWFNLYDYQKQRITTFLNPERNPLGSGYHIIQSKIAIGSGGFLGKGYLKGSQSQLNFIPEKQTDFVFALFTEEFGFVGALLLLLVYAALIVNFFIIALNAKSNFGKYAVIGITSVLFAHVFINISMVSGILPVVGVPLPLISFGGTSMTALMAGFGLILNIAKNNRIV